MRRKAYYTAVIYELIFVVTRIDRLLVLGKVTTLKFNVMHVRASCIRRTFVGGFTVRKNRTYCTTLHKQMKILGSTTLIFCIVWIYMLYLLPFMYGKVSPCTVCMMICNKNFYVECGHISYTFTFCGHVYKLHICI